MRSTRFRRRDFLQYLLAGSASAGLANLTAAFAQPGDTGAGVTTTSPLAAGRPSEIVFDFSVPPAMMEDQWRSALEASAARVAAIGEPWIAYFDPSALATELRGLGFSQLENLDAEQANQRYFTGRTDGFRVMGPGQVLTARV